MKNSNGKHDAIYARYSSHNQDDGTSIDVQLEQCERAAKNGNNVLPFCRHYIDRAKTGRAMNGRAQLLQLLADAEAGKVGRVFVYKFDRLGRAAETHLIAQQLDDAGVELVSATEGTNQLSRGIQLVVAEDYSRQLANRTRDGLVKRFEQRGFTGGISPYGYRVVDRDGRRTLEINPDEAAVIRDVVRQYLEESVGFKILARRLRQRGIASRRGGGWTFTSVRALLINPVLAGRIRYNVRKMQLDRKTGRRVPRFRDKAEIIERQDETLRIIDDAEFQQIHARLRKLPGYARLARGVANFTGLLYCPCGSRLTRKKSERKGHTYHYWTCSRHLRLEDCQHNGGIREDRLLIIIQDRFAHLFEQKDRIIARACQIAAKAASGNRAEADRMKADLATLDRKLGHLSMRLADPDLSNEPLVKKALVRQTAELQGQRDALQGALDGLRDDANVNTETLAKAVRGAFADARKRLADVTTPEQLNRFVEQFVGTMQVAPDGQLKQLPLADAKGNVQDGIAGARCKPLHIIQDAFWKLPKAA